MAAWSEEFFGGQTIHSILAWSILGQLMSPVIAPVVESMTQAVRYEVQTKILGLADLADAVVRGVMTVTKAIDTARYNGLTADAFKTLVHLAGEPPGLQSVLEWWRRGFIEFGEPGPTKANVANAIATGRVYTYWTDTIKKAQFVPPSVAEAVNAKLRNQITEDEAVALAYFAGLGTPSLSVPAGHDTTDTKRAFQILLDTAGRPPAVGELLTLWRRGFIEPGDLTPNTVQPTANALTFSQGILEGDTKDKWLPQYANLFTQYPSEYYVHMMLKTGQITKTQALDLLKKFGYTTKVAEGIAGAAGAAANATYKHLTVDIIAELYTMQAITKTEASTLLKQYGAGADAIPYILEYLDLKRFYKYLNSAITKIGTQYVNHKITQDQARTALARFGVPANAVQTLLATWQLEATSIVKLPTESQIIDAYKYGIVKTPKIILSRLEQLGYTPYDAWLVASAALHAPITTSPPTPGPNPYYGTPANVGT